MSKTSKQTNDALCRAAVKSQQSFGVVPKQKKMNVKGDFRFLWTMKLSRLWTDLCRIVWRSIGANKIKGSVYSTIRQDHGCIRTEYWLLSLWQRGHWGSYFFFFLIFSCTAEHLHGDLTFWICNFPFLTVFVLGRAQWELDSFIPPLRTMKFGL